MASKAPVTSLPKVLGFDGPPASTPSPRYSRFSELMALQAPPASAPAPVGLGFQHWRFSEPTAFNTASLPACPGIYAVLVIDGAWGPRPYRPLYFGKAENLATRVSSSHENYREWRRASNGFGALYVAYHRLPGINARQRSIIEESLIRHYSPECNRTFNSLAGLFR